MKKVLALLLTLCFALSAAANDGSFAVSGNQLIPINETDISVHKEILSLERIRNQIKVTVYYEFFNPADPKDLLVGFEASGPYMFSMEEALKAFPEHPNMRGFNVVMNGESITWQVAHVKNFGHFDDNGEWVNDPYYKDGKFRKMSDKQCREELKVSEEAFDYPFQFVYYFTAPFKTGLNIIEHTYSYDLSSGSGTMWYFPYVLSAACRWANRQIDDFTLHVNMGDRESFCIAPSFFSNYSEWTFDVAGRVDPDAAETWGFLPEDSRYFHVREGGITFHKKDFRPKGELYAFVPFDGYYSVEEGEEFCFSSEEVKDFISQKYISLSKPSSHKYPINLEARSILRNLPFAYRGYVFKKAALQRVFEATPWYVPNPSYTADMESLSKGEKEWVMFWAKGGQISAVDMGLSVKWASCNVGASNPEDSGDYFAWGETEPYYSSLNPLKFKSGYESGYEWSSYTWCVGDDYNRLTKYSTSSWYSRIGSPDKKTVLEPADDAARVNLGDSWRMPTSKEWWELMDERNCKWEWSSRNGVKGFLVTSNKTGNSIFLPAAGNIGGTSIFDTDGGYYLSSSLCTSDESSADGILFDSYGVIGSAFGRSMGQCVRAVTD